MMNAAEARKITDDALANSATVFIRKSIKERIHRRALEGESTLAEPFTISRNGHRLIVTQAQEDAVIKTLKAEGYEFNTRGEEDEGDPRNHPYLEISW